MRPDSTAWVTLARILRPWGRRGEVAAEVLTDFPGRLAALPEVRLSREGGSPQTARITSSRVHLGQAILHFDGVDTITAAEALRGFEVQIPIEERAAIGPGRHYISDLIGCEVREEGANGALGTVTDVQRAGDGAATSTPEAWLLVLQTAAGELLIPLAEEICTQIDTSARRICVRLPEGLRELNER